MANWDGGPHWMGLIETGRCDLLNLAYTSREIWRCIRTKLVCISHMTMSMHHTEDQPPTTPKGVPTLYFPEFMKLSVHLTDGVWGWTDGSELDYEDWLYPEPSGDGDVASINFNGDWGFWNDASSSNDYKFFCKMEKCMCVYLPLVLFKNFLAVKGEWASQIFFSQSFWT